MAKNKKTHGRQAKTKRGIATAKPAQGSRASLPALTGTDPVASDRRSSGDRRAQSDRRQATVPVPVERRKLERRVKVNRRRQIDPTTCERDYTADEIEFMNAMDQYKRSSGRMFPTCSEILEVVRKLGYEKRSQFSHAAPAHGITVADVFQPGSGG